MSEPQRLLLMGEGVGTHEERVQLTRFLVRSRRDLYGPASSLATLRESACQLSAADVTHDQLEGDLTRPLSAAALHHELLSAQRAREGEPPWTWRLPLYERSYPLMNFGPFTLCFDDSLLDDPAALLIHQGREGGFRVAPPALTLPTQGRLLIAEFEIIHHDVTRLSVKLYGVQPEKVSAPHSPLSLLLTQGPWWLTPPRGEVRPYHAHQRGLV